MNKFCKYLVIYILTRIKKIFNWCSEITFEKEINIISLVAFCISISTLLIQFSAIRKGYEVTCYPGTMTLIMRGETLRVVLLLTYMNDGDAIHGSTTIKNETLTFYLSNGSYEYESYKFLQITRDRENQEYDKLLYEYLGSSVPFVVKGQDTESHETQFGPTQTFENCKLKTNSMQFNSFKKYVEKSNSVKLELKLYFADGKTFKKTGMMLPDDSDINHLNSRKWTTDYVKWDEKLEKIK